MEPKWEIYKGSLEMRKLRSGKDLSEIALEDIKVNHQLGRESEGQNSGLLAPNLVIFCLCPCALIRISKHCVNIHSGPNVVLDPQDINVAKFCPWRA